MTPKHKWTTAELRSLHDAANAGQTRQQVADKLGVSLSSVTSACYRHGVFFDRYSRARSPTLDPLPATQETGP